MTQHAYHTALSRVSRPIRARAKHHPINHLKQPPLQCKILELNIPIMEPTSSTDYLNGFFRCLKIDEEYLAGKVEYFAMRLPRLRRLQNPNNPSEEIITFTDPKPPEDFLGQWVFEVAVVTWDGPYDPSLTWKPFRYWKTEPDEARITRAKEAALRATRFFKLCSYCKKINNAGHMCDNTTCQSCASEHLGVVY